MTFIKNMAHNIYEYLKLDMASKFFLSLFFNYFISLEILDCKIVSYVRFKIVSYVRFKNNRFRSFFL